MKKIYAMIVTVVLVSAIAMPTAMGEASFVKQCIKAAAGRMAAAVTENHVYGCYRAVKNRNPPPYPFCNGALLRYGQCVKRQCAQHAVEEQGYTSRYHPSRAISDCRARMQHAQSRGKGPASSPSNPACFDLVSSFDSCVSENRP